MVIGREPTLIYSSVLLKAIGRSVDSSGRSASETSQSSLRALSPLTRWTSNVFPSEDQSQTRLNQSVDTPVTGCSVRFAADHSTNWVRRLAKSCREYASR